MSRPATAEQPQAPNIDEHVDPSAPPTKELGTIAAAEQDGEQHDFVLGAEWEQSRSSCASSYCLEEFTADMVPLALCELGPTADGRSLAHLTLRLQHTTLPSTLPLAAFTQLQALVLSHNCLTDLRGLERLPHLTSLDVSHNQLTQVVLDLPLPPGQPSNLRRASFAHNAVGQIRSLARFSRLQALDLGGNAIEHASGLEALAQLESLDLGGNRLRSCRGLGGCGALRQLQLGGNQVTSLAGLGGLEHLTSLGVAGNQLRDLQGCEQLRSLQRLDASGNPIGTLQALAPAAAAALASLDVRGCPLQLLQCCRLHVLYLLPGLTQLDGRAAGPDEKVAAANMHGADAAGLVAIRQRYFPDGDLDDGGGAMLPICAGLQPSAAEEEQAAAPGDPYLLADVWAQSVGLQVAEAGGVAGLAQRLAAGCTKPGEQQQLQLARACYTWVVSRAKAPKGDLGDVHAPAFDEPQLLLHVHVHGDGQEQSPSVAARRSGSSAGSLEGAAGEASSVPSSRRGSSSTRASSAASCRRAAPHTEAWVQAQAADEEGEAAAGSAPPAALRGRAEAALLGGVTGSWAERVSSLLAQLCKACGLLAVQISGFARGGGLMGGLQPGQRLAAHNHSWVAVKVNGRWRLLDPAYAATRAGDAPFFTPPEAFAHSHLPFESYWQLLQRPLSCEQWWALPEVSPQFFAAGMQLLSSGLAAVNVLPASGPGQRLPALRVLVAAPDAPHQHLQLSILDAQLSEVASWQVGACGGSSGGGSSSSSSSSPGRQLVFQQAGQLPSAPPEPASDGAPAAAAAAGIVQLPGMAPAALPPSAPAPAAGEQLEVRFGARRFGAGVLELWAAPPGPGEWHLALQLVRVLPAAVQLRVEGLEQPLRLDLQHSETVLRAKVVVPPPALHEPSTESEAAAGAAACTPASLPSATQAFGALRCQLLSPAAHQVLEADRPCSFRLAVPGARAVVVGAEEVGWWALNREQPAPAPPVGAVGPAEQAPAAAVAVFSAELEVPRCSTCHVLASFDPAALPAALAGASGSAADAVAAAAGGWVPLLALAVTPQVQHVVALPQPQVSSHFLDSDALVHQAREMFAGLDANGDGFVSRRAMLLGFRSNRQWADFLRFPHKAREGDGSLQRFHERFLQVNTDKLGLISFEQLAAAYITERGGQGRAKPTSSQSLAGSLLQQHLAAAAGGSNGSSGGGRPTSPSTVRSRASRASRATTSSKQHAGRSIEGAHAR